MKYFSFNVLRVVFCFVFSFFVISTGAEAATYYLSPAGNNNNNTGAITSPWFSLERAWQTIQAGDTVYLRGGTYAYSDMQYLQGKNGTAGNLIKIWAYPGETPNITRSASYAIVNGVDQDLIYFEGNYFHFKGLEISYFEQKPNETGYPAFRAGFTSYSIFENINYHHNMSAFQIRGNSTGNLILNSDFHHNKDPYGPAPYDGADGLGITFNYDPNSVNTIRGSRAYWNADDGFDTWENQGSVIIENSWAFFNGYIPDTFTTAGNGTAFKLGSMSTPSTQTKRTLKNNLAYKNRFAGFVENNAGVKMELYNNTSVNAGYTGYWFGAWGGNGNVTIAKNNLDYQGGNPPGPWNGASTITNNSWQNNISVTNADFANMTDSQLMNSRKADGSLPDITFLSLAANSDLINAGTPISGMTYNGSAPDIGAFEYGGVTPPPSNTTPTSNAGTDQTITLPTSSVTLTGSGTDSDGTISSYSWTKVSSLAGTITSPSSASTTVTGLTQGTHTFRLTVTDNGGLTASDDVVIIVNPAVTTGGNTYYLSPTGNDNNACTQVAPCFTLQKAWTLVSAGSTVYLRGGTYTYTKQQGLTGKSGTAGNLIKVWAYPGETPIITRSATGYTTDIYWHRSGIFFRGNYVHFKGLEITGYKNISGNVEDGLLAYDANNNIFEQLNIHHNFHGMYIENNSSNNLILNSDFHDNYTDYNGGGDSDGLGISYNTGANNVVEGSRAWNNGDDGFDTFEAKGLVTFKNSWAWHNGYQYGTSTPAGNGVGFKLGSNFLQGTTLQNTVVRVLQNTISADNRDSGYHINEGDHRTQLYNNVSYGNVVTGLNFHWNNLVHTFKNNVSFGNGNNQVEVSTNSISTNNSYGAGSSDGGSGWAQTASATDFVSLDITQLDNPRNADGSLPTITAFTLAPTSDLINAGTNVGLPFSGSAPDIGAFEYGGVVTTPTDTTSPTTPTNLSSTGTTQTQTTLSWSASTDAVGVSGYRVFRNGTQIATTATPSYTATGLTASTTYSFTVSAYDAAGNVSAQSTAVSVTTSGTTTSGIFVSGDRVQVYGGGVRVRSGATTSASSLGTQASGNLGTIVGGPVSANGYIWWNVNYNTGADGWSIQNRLQLYISTTPTDTTAPVVAFTTPNINATLTGAVILSATATDNTGISRVEFHNGNTLVGTDITSPYSVSWLTTSFTNGTYNLSAKAYDSANNTGTATVTVSLNNVVTTPTDTTSPTTPTNLSSTGTTQTQTTLSWTASIDSVGVSGYRVFRNGTQIATTATPSYTATGLTASTTYSFTVSAYDAAGNVSAQSTAVSVTTASTTNTAPTANAGADQTITLPTNSVTLTGSGTDVGGSIASYAWTKVSGGSATITSPSSATTTVTGLVQGTYSFWLTVTDNGGSTNADAVIITVNPATVTSNGSPILVANAINDAGFSYRISQNFGTPADIVSSPLRSTLRVFENGIELAQSHADHGQIETVGLGRFSHWMDEFGYEALYLSTTDNTNPVTNGRTYTFRTDGVAGTGGGSVGGTVSGFTDNFNRANSTTIGSSWSERYGASDFTINGNKVLLSTNDTEVSSLHTTSGLTSANYTVQSKVSFTSRADIMYAGISGRRSDFGSTDSSGYMVFIEPYDQMVTLYKRDSGQWTLLGTYQTTITTGTEYSIGLAMNGASISALWNGSPVISVTDSTFSQAGSTGIITGNGFPMTGIKWDDFGVTVQ